MGLTIEVNTLEEMCALMCDNEIPKNKKMNKQITMSDYLDNKQKPIAEPVTGNPNKRFEIIYKCYCPKCNKLLKRSEEKCSCGQEIDWSEWV